MKGEHQLYTKAFFKSTDRNSYIPVQSGHHPRWLRNIPKGKFTRIRRNCTFDNDYATQAELVKIQFVENRYKPHLLEKTIEEVGMSTQDAYLVPTAKQQDPKHEWGFISSYHEQYHEIEFLLLKNTGTCYAWIGCWVMSCQQVHLLYIERPVPFGIR